MEAQFIILHTINPTRCLGPRHDDRRQLGFLARGAAALPLLKCGTHRLAAGRMRGTGVRACGLPSENAGDGDEKGSSHGKARAKMLAVGTAAALVCVAGIACSRHALLARAATGWRLVSDVRSSPMEHDTRSDVERLHALLSDALERMKKKSMPDHKRSLASLISEWEKIPGNSLDKYENGLSLLEILINRRQYAKASQICKKLEGYKIAPENDERLPLRRFIIDLSILLEGVKVGKKQDLRAAVEDANSRWEKFKDKYDFWAKPQTFSTTTPLPPLPPPLPPPPPPPTK